MTTGDRLYLALIAIGLMLDHFVTGRGFIRLLRVDPARARRWFGLGVMLVFWPLMAAGMALWHFEGRPWAALRLVMPSGWRLWGSTALVLALALHYTRTLVRIARSKRKRIQIEGAAGLIPRTRSELGSWVAVSVTAGVCEEFVFRGYLIWVLTDLLGLWGAAAVSLVIFGLAHSYQGVKGILPVGALAIVFTLVVLISGSLFPAMMLHAMVDTGEGLVGWAVFRKYADADADADAYADAVAAS